MFCLNINVRISSEHENEPRDSKKGKEFLEQLFKNNSTKWSSLFSTLAKLVEVKLTLCLFKYHALKKCLMLNYTPCNEDVWRNEGIAARILSLFWDRREWSGSPPGKEASVPIGEEARWITETVWTRWRREKFPAPIGNRISVVHLLAKSLY
jgi:hypothetical protein